jgi:hypothetical protein
VTDRQGVLREAANVVQLIAHKYRQGQFGEELTSREIRDAVEHASLVLTAMANDPSKTLDQILEED